MSTTIERLQETAKFRDDTRDHLARVQERQANNRKLPDEASARLQELGVSSEADVQALEAAAETQVAEAERLVEQTREALRRIKEGENNRGMADSYADIRCCSLGRRKRL